MSTPPVHSEQAPAEPLPEGAPAPAALGFSDLVDGLIAGYGKDGTHEGKNAFSGIVRRYLKQELAKAVDVVGQYNVLILYDNSAMIKGDSDQIYASINSFQDKTKPLLLVLVSNGGEPGSAYLIGKLCREVRNSKFVVVIPRHAKSAATLLACAADEIHMGSVSELGPIDPQIDGLPALGLKNSVEHIAKLVSASPGASDMFASYLTNSIKPIQIGYYERVAESAMQYAERLLNDHKDHLADSPHNIAYRLVYSYMDHGFIIDKAEATEIFGAATVKANTPEYLLGNIVYEVMSQLERFAGVFAHNFYFIGSPDSSPTLTARRRQ